MPVFSKQEFFSAYFYFRASLFLSFKSDCQMQMKGAGVNGVNLRKREDREESEDARRDLLYRPSHFKKHYNRRDSGREFERKTLREAELSCRVSGMRL
jgi:hypothetical protein